MRAKHMPIHELFLRKVINMEHNQRRCGILIVGLGNVLLMDDGVGVHAIRELQKNPPHDACLAEVGTAVLRAVHVFEWAERIIAIDAVKADGPPGTIYALDAKNGESRGHPVSLHELSLWGALRFLPPGCPKPRLVILGVEPETIDYGLDLSATVQAALPQVVQTVREVADSWKRNPETWSLAELRGAIV